MIGELNESTSGNNNMDGSQVEVVHQSKSNNQDDSDGDDVENVYDETHVFSDGKPLKAGKKRASTLIINSHVDIGKLDRVCRKVCVISGNGH
ncbi:hypothetical protein Tco_0216128 [Tanacetum coccineum]